MLAELNIVGSGMRGGKYEDNLDDMDGKLTGDKAKLFPGVIVGVKSAHFTGPEWKPYDQAVIAGNIANVPVMIDYGARRIERPLLQLVSDPPAARGYLHALLQRPARRAEPRDGRTFEALLVMRKRGIYCDVGHGGGSFCMDGRRAHHARVRLPAGFHLDRPSRRLHEQRHEGHPERGRQADGGGRDGAAGDRADDLAPGA